MTDPSRLADLQWGWRELITSGRLPSVFQHPGWVEAWWRYFSDNKAPFVVVGWDGDSIVGIVPLMIDRATREVQFIGHPLNDRNGAVCAEGYLDALWAVTVDLLGHHGVASACLPELLDADVAALSSLGRTEVRLTPGLPSPLIELPTTWDEFLARHNSRRIRSWRRDEVRLANLGVVQFECLAGKDVNDDLMCNFHSARIERWSFTGQLDQLCATERGAGFKQFLVRLARNLAPEEMLRLGRLRVGATVAAQNLYLVWPGVVLNYMSTHQPRLRAYSPGTQATLAGIRHFISADRQVFDFGRGDEPYKFTFGAKARNLRGAAMTFDL